MLQIYHNIYQNEKPSKKQDKLTNENQIKYFIYSGRHQSVTISLGEWVTSVWESAAASPGWEGPSVLVIKGGGTCCGVGDCGGERGDFCFWEARCLLNHLEKLSSWNGVFTCLIFPFSPMHSGPDLPFGGNNSCPPWVLIRSSSNFAGIFFYRM